MPQIISQQKSAFIPGCTIADNSILASEIAIFLHKRRMGKNGIFALKLDMSKAYDRIE